MSKMTRTSWIILIIVTGVVDFVQLVFIEFVLVWLFGVGVAINEFLDPIVGVAIGGYLQMFGKVPIITRPNRVIALCGAEIAAAISAGVAQCWILSVWYIWSDVRKEEARITAAAAATEGPLYQNARRQGSRVGPANMDGRRMPQEPAEDA